MNRMACDAGFADELEEWWDGLTAEEQESARACVKLLDSSGIRKIDAMSGQIGPALQDPDRKPQKPDHISQRDWNDAEIPEWTAEDFAAARPLKEVHPELAEWSAARRRGQRGPQKAPVKVALKLRVDPDVIEAYKSTGRGWQTRMNDALRRGIKQGA